ncbi:MAG TPA: tetratricopeptide repeat protein, partial [Polyangia bacterium]|nr:tetratricopeptide repeat protein [Polyangia bacterium]
RGFQVVTRPALCRGAESKLAGVWDQTVKAQVRKAFFGTGASFASDAFWSVNRLIEGYVQRWTGTYVEACEATHVRGEQSAEVLDLRMSCLHDRLNNLKALTTVFTQANGAVVENAVSAASQLGAIDRCNDVKLLRAMLPPPEDPAARRRVEQLQEQVADARAQLAAGQLAEAEKATALLVANARRVEYGPLLAEALWLRGHALVDMGNASEAERILEEGLWTAEAARHDEAKAEMAIALLYAVYLEGVPRPKDTERWLHLAEATLRRIGGHPRLQIWSNNAYADALDLEGRREEALARRLQSEAIAARSLSPTDPDLVRVHGNLAHELSDLNRPAEALAHSDKAVEIARKVLGTDHPEMATQMSNRAEILNQLERWQEARASASRALELWEKQLGKDHPFVAYALSGIGASYLGEGKPAFAVAPLERALRIRLAKEPSPALIAEVEFALARAFWDSNQQRERARALARSALERFGAEPSKSKPRAEITVWLAKHGNAALSAN